MRISVQQCSRQPGPRMGQLAVYAVGFHADHGGEQNPVQYRVIVVVNLRGRLQALGSIVRPSLGRHKVFRAVILLRRP